MILRDYQRESVDRIKADKACGLFLEPGLGKTIIVLKALEELKKEGRPHKTLILAPIRVVETVWEQEAKKWGIDLTFAKIRGQPAERTVKLKRDADVFLVNFEMMDWLFNSPVFIKFLANPLITRALVVDESTMLKSPKTKRWKVLKKNITRFQKRLILTGTPIPNTYLDLWTQIGILDRGRRLETAFGRFCKTYFEQDFSGFNWVIKSGSAKLINDKVKDIVQSVHLEEALVDDPIEVKVDIHLTPAEMKKYKEMEKESIANFYNSLDEDVEEVPAFSAAALHMKLSQLSQGFIYNLDKNAIEFHDRKMETLKDIVEELNGKSVLVIYKFLHEVAKMKEMFGDKLTILNEHPAEQVVESWNRGEIQILAMHPKSGGHGLNLQFGGSHIVMTCPLYSSEHYDQVVRRLARHGQEHAVIVQVLRAMGTVDEVIDNRLGERINVQNAFMEYVDYKKER